ncbi:MAG: T9SS type A sorting domain-containing protein, partial [Candidatus Fermentibacteraceae bacterium]|nr:T9SS type A sorting domain-containing protein [Candidatus Fermentibacteraceae bacterium]
KVSDERPVNDASIYDEFWRQYLWDMDDTGYPVFNEVLNSGVLVFWDGQTKNYGWSTTPVFTDSLHAVDIISKWTRAIIPDAASGNRPIQPNVIAHEHNGNCGETQDLLCAAARVALIPCACVMDINEDHVWCSIWWDGEWRGWYVDTVNNHNVAYDKDYGGSKDCSCIWAWRNDGYTWDVADYYSQFCTFTVTVTDSADVPIDNADVQIASEGWQTSTLYRGTWGQTDRNGQISFILGDNQNYYMNISCALGTFGSGGYQEVITGSVPGQTYIFDWSPPELMPGIPATEVPEGSWTKYLIQVEFDLPADLMNGRDYYASPLSEYAEPLTGGTADFFIVDSANFDLYQAGSPFECYKLLEGQSTGEVWFYAPHTDNWFIVFAGDRHQGVQTFAQAEITLWRHDGTGMTEESTAGQTVSVTPNPCSAQVSVQFATMSPAAATVRLYDLQGRLVSTTLDDVLEAGSHTLEIDTASLAGGLYFVRVDGSGVNAVRSIAVIR